MQIQSHTNVRKSKKNTAEKPKKVTNKVSGLPAISKLDSDDDSAPDAGSDEDFNVEDDDDLGMLNFQMNKNSVVGASSGRGFANFKYRASGVGSKMNNLDTLMQFS